MGTEAPETESGPDAPVSLTESSALIPLLLVFAFAVVAIFATLLLGARKTVTPGDTAADRPYGPADFPAVFSKDDALTGLAGAHPEGTVAVPAPPLTEGIYPCSMCHAGMEVNPTRRDVEAHPDIVLEHDQEHRWCLDCHDAKDRDHLRLASGAKVEFTESYQLCGQCHGTQYRDWKVGIHGKRTGYWNGAKRYLLCVHCHSPHRPRFAPMQPLPPPVRPQSAFARSAMSAGQPRR